MVFEKNAILSQEIGNIAENCDHNIDHSQRCVCRK
jgi:hypothetical protein